MGDRRSKFKTVGVESRSAMTTSRYVPIHQEQVKDRVPCLEQLCEKDGALVVILVDGAGRHIKLKFASLVAYRRVYEGDALLILAAMKRSGGTGKWLYQVDDSDFVAWHRLQRGGPMRIQEVLHFTIATQDEIIDVLSTEAPVINLES